MIYSHIKICSQDVSAERIRTEIKQKAATHEHQTQPAEGLRKGGYIYKEAVSCFRVVCWFLSSSSAVESPERTTEAGETLYKSDVYSNFMRATVGFLLSNLSLLHIQHLPFSLPIL